MEYSNRIYYKTEEEAMEDIEKIKKKELYGCPAVAVIDTIIKEWAGTKMAKEALCALFYVL